MYRKHKVIMLPTTDTPTNGVQPVWDNSIRELFIPNTGAECRRMLQLNKFYIVNHLYILSDEKIKVGDWYIVDLYNSQDVKTITLEKCEKIDETEIWVNKHPVDSTRHIQNCKKVIATTDTTLNLPLIPKEFVEDYCKNQVEEVMVEYVEECECRCHRNPNYIHMMPCCYPGLKVTDNYISIKPTKSSWSKEEVINLFKNYPYLQNFNTCDIEGEPTFLDKWLQENL